MEKISVIVPIFNAEIFLDRCVTSIREQTYKNLEIILVDDGSPDGCPKMCDDFASADDRIRVIHKENGGQGLARNDGLNIATGEYVTFVDSDDWIASDHIENLYNAVKKSNGDVALGNHTRVTAEGNSYCRHLPLREGVYEGDSIVEDILLPLIGADLKAEKDVLINSSVSMNLYRRESIEKNSIRFISERYAVAEDYFFNVDFFHFADRIVFTKEAGYFYRQNPESTCEKYNPKRFERTLNYYNEISKRVKMYGLSERVNYRKERSFLMKIRVAIRHIALSNMDKAEKFSKINEILSNHTVKKVLNEYPIENFTFSMELLMKKMRKQKVKSVYSLMVMREKGRNKKGLKTMLRFIGIGR